MAESTDAAAATNPGAESIKPKFGGGGVPCTTCTKTVYPAETIQFELKPYHIECFKCLNCSKKISAPEAAQYENKIYCRPCFAKLGFARKQTQITQGGEKKANHLASQFGGGSVPCTVCSNAVYPAETLQFELKPYHAKCFKCKSCDKEMKTNDAEKYEESVYCRPCFKKEGLAAKQTNVTFVKKEVKPASYRFANLGGGGAKCTTCEKTVYPAETLQWEQKPYHIKCFGCKNCKKNLAAADAEKAQDGFPYCKKCYMELGLFRPVLNPTSS